MKYTHTLLYSVLIIFIACSAGYGQHYIKGTVIDSASLAPMPYVTVKIKNFDRGAITDEFGGFTVKTSLFDTLVISSVGYLTQQVPVHSTDSTLMVRLVEVTNFLRGVTIHDRIQLPGVVPGAAQSNWVNSSMRKEYGLIQTAGVGYVISGPLSHFSKSEKEKRKLAEVRADNNKARGYIEVVTSPQVKDSLISKYALTEAQFYELLAQFNKANPKSIGLEPKSLIFSIFHFYDAEIKKSKKATKAQ